jgi:hypothetical protein
LAKKKSLDQNADFFADLMKMRSRFQSAQAINHSLNDLYELVARDRISVRRARTLAYISSLLLRSLAVIDSDNSKGIRDPLSTSPSPAKPPATSPSPAAPAAAAPSASVPSGPTPSHGLDASLDQKP